MINHNLDNKIEKKTSIIKIFFHIKSTKFLSHKACDYSYRKNCKWNKKEEVQIT